MKNSSSESFSNSSCNTNSTESSSSEENYDTWFCHFLDKFHSEIETLQNNHMLDKNNYKDELIKYFSKHKDINFEHCLRLGIYLDIDPNIILSRYLKYNGANTNREF